MMPPHIVVGPRPVAVLGLLLGTCATAAFGNSLQSITVLAWLQPLVLLLAYEGAVRTLRSSIVAHVGIILVQALGFTVAFAGTLSYPHTTVSSLLATLGLGSALATATTLGALLPAARLRSLAAEQLPTPQPQPRGGPPHPARPLTPLGYLLLALPVWAFPVLQSAVFTVTGFQLGHFHEPGVALSDWPALAQLASLFGLWGLNFILNLAASAICCVATFEPLPLTAPAEPPGSATDAGAGGNRGSGGGGGGGWSRLARPLRRHVLGVAWVLWLLAVVGGGLVYSDSFYQQPVGQRLARERRLPVSCLAAEAVDVGSEGYVWLWQKTAERVAAGDSFVLWSEEAVVVRTAAEEAALLATGRDLLVAHGSVDPAGGTYLGLCYEKLLLADGAGGPAAGVEGLGAADAAGEEVSRSGRGTAAGTPGSSPPRAANHFVLLGPNGTTLWDYRKAFPVPVVEAQVVAGPRRLPTAPSSYGTLGGAICFDMDRPQYVRQAGAAGVDLLLQPSWTWGDVGPRHFASDALRAVENGFTTFRCSSDGVSGVVTPRGVAPHYLLTADRDVLTFGLPLRPRVRTAYVAAGWALEWVNLAAAAALLGLLAAPRARLSRWVRWSRGGGGAGSGGDGWEWVEAGQSHPQQEPLLQTA